MTSSVRGEPSRKDACRESILPPHNLGASVVPVGPRERRRKQLATGPALGPRPDTWPHGGPHRLCESGTTLDRSPIGQRVLPCPARFARPGGAPAEERTVSFAGPDFLRPFCRYLTDREVAPPTAPATPPIANNLALLAVLRKQPRFWRYCPYPFQGRQVVATWRCWNRQWMRVSELLGRAHHVRDRIPWSAGIESLSTSKNAPIQQPGHIQHVMVNDKRSQR